MTSTKNLIVKVLQKRFLTESAYVLRLERRELKFGAGQYISLGLPGNSEKREYSIYSGENDDYLELLVKEIDRGLVSRQLRLLREGALVEMSGPFGFFKLKEENKIDRKPVFIASGTGIAPFHSFVRSNPVLDYKLIHGVRTGKEAYDRMEYDRSRYLLCTSREDTGDYHGRVTDYIRENPPGLEHDYYLCGNSRMIHDVYNILTDQGVEAIRIYAEVYF